MNPFSRVPRGRFHRRVFWIAVLAGALVFPSIGMVARLPEIQALEKSPSTLVPPKLIQARGLYDASWEHLRNTRSHFRDQPEVCREGRAQSEFLQSECARVKGRTWAALGVSLFPLLIVGFIYWVLRDQMTGFYRVAKRKIEQEKGFATGTVTQPALLPVRLGDWLLCVRRVSLALPTGKQLAIWVPIDAPQALPGQKWVVYEMGRWLGKNRVVGALYAPHLMVVTGSR